MDILRAKKSHPPSMPVSPSKRITSAEIVPADAQANDVALDESSFLLPPAPPHTGFEDVGMANSHADNPYVLGPGPLDPNMPQQQYVHPYGGQPAASTEFAPTFPEAGPSTNGSGEGANDKAQEDAESSDEESSDSSSDSDDSDDD